MWWTGSLALLAVWTGPLVDGHVHKAPHAGVVAHAGAYHLELVVKDATIEVWLLDQNERVVRPVSGSSVSLTVNRALARPVKGTKRVVLRWSGDHFESSFGLDPLTGFSARALLVVGGKRLRANFTVTLLDLRHRLVDPLDLDDEKLDDENVDAVRK